MSFFPQLKIPKQEIKKQEHHSLKIMVLKNDLFSEEGALMRRRAWIDNATVCELCLEAVKIPKCLGTKSMNAKEAREALGDVEEK